VTDYARDGAGALECLRLNDHLEFEDTIISIKREAAFHEAGHAVAAYRSRFHFIVGPISLAGYGSGEIYVAQSRSKCVAAGKASDHSAQKDPEVAADLALVLSAGLVSERIAHERDPAIRPNPECAIPDHDLMRQQLARAGLSKKFDQHEKTARELLESNWALVDALAEFLLARVNVQPEEVLKFIEGHRHLPKPTSTENGSAE
jgi:hypothetical protein